MIRLNLLPQEMRRRKGGSTTLVQMPSIADLQLKRYFWYALGGLLALYTVVFLILVVQTLFVQGLRKEWELLSPKQEEITQLVKEYERLSAQEKAVHDLLGRKFLWSRKLEQLNESIVPGVWLQELALGERTKAAVAAVVPPPPAVKGRGRKPAPPALKKEKLLILSGSATSSKGEDENAVIGRFIRSLQENKGFFADFSLVDLEYAKRRLIHSLEVVDFKIICVFQEEALL